MSRAWCGLPPGVKVVLSSHDYYHGQQEDVDRDHDDEDVDHDLDLIGDDVKKEGIGCREDGNDESS